MGGTSTNHYNLASLAPYIIAVGMSLAPLLDANKHLSLTANNKIKCSITGHEMPANYKVVNDYLQSKKLLKAKEWYAVDYSKYLPYIIPHKRDPKKLFCKLTTQKLNKIPHEIEKHIAGKKFQRLKKEFEENKDKKPLPDQEEEDDAEVSIRYHSYSCN